MKQVLAALLPIVLVAAGLSYAAMQPAPTPLSVEVVGQADPGRTGMVTELQVELTNPGDEPVRPKFSVPSNRLKNWYTWTINAGPETLPAGGTAVYDLHQPPYTGIPRGESFQVVASDIESPTIRGTSPLTLAAPPSPEPAVVNPGFRSWIPAMIAPYDLPFGWIPVAELHGDDQMTIQGTDGSLNLSLELDTTRTERTGSAEDWSMVALRQRIEFPDQLRVTVHDGDRSSFSGGPQVLVGVLLEDPHRPHQLMVLFTEHPTDEDQAAVRTLQLGETTSVRYLVTNRTQTIDLPAVWRDQGWALPTPREVDERFPSPAGQVGMGALAVEAAYDRFEVMRPIELKVLLASFPPHQQAELEARFSFVGGPAYDQGS